MKAKILHERAMQLSFEAKEAAAFGQTRKASELYMEAAQIESEVAEYYFDKPEFEPTRSILIRSAAFVNLKAGNVETAQKFIFFGLLNSRDEEIRAQLQEALELSMALRDDPMADAGHNMAYLTLLRHESIDYVLEPVNPMYDRLVTMEMLHDFSNNYLKSIRAYGAAVYKRMISQNDDGTEVTNHHLNLFKEQIQPLITRASFGSFRFSIVNDVLNRVGESPELTRLKSNIVDQFHHNVLTRELTDETIKETIAFFDVQELNDIYRPLSKIKSLDADYKVSYFERNSMQKREVGKIRRVQAKKLLPVRELSTEDIGILERKLVHKTGVNSGRKKSNTVFLEEMKYSEWEIKVKEISHPDRQSLLLNEELMIEVIFDSDSGFTFGSEDFDLSFTAPTYAQGLNKLMSMLYDYILSLLKLDVRNPGEEKHWRMASKLINNLDAI